MLYFEETQKCCSCMNLNNYNYVELELFFSESLEVSCSGISC